MKPRLQEICDAQWADLEVGLELLNRTQGDGLFDGDYLQRRTQCPEAFVLAGYLGQDLVALGCAEVIHDLDYYRPFDAAISTRLKGRKTGSLNTLSVVEAWQGRGIGQQMSLARLNWLARMGCEVVLGVSWVSQRAHTSDRVFRKIGFREVSRVDRFYREQALRRPFACPGCHSQPCDCAAVLYELAITPESLPDTGVARAG